MLQIFVFGDTEEGFLDIDPGTTLDMESLSDAFDEDLSTGEYSIPIDIPWTDKNRRLFGFAERLENFRVKPKSFKIAVYDDGWAELPSGMLTILEKSGLLSYKRGKFSATVSGNKGLYGRQIKGKKLTDLQLCGKISWATDESREFAEKHMKGLTPQYDYLAFAPVAIEQFFDTDRLDYNNEFLAKDTVNTVIVTGAGINDWTFGRPLSSSPGTPTDDSTPEHQDYRTIPFLRLKFVLRKVFEEFGFTVSGDFINDSAFDDLFLFNNYGIENYALYNFASTAYSDYNRSIYPSNHVPKIAIVDFLKGVFSLFNLYPIFYPNNEVRLTYRYNNLRNRRVVSLNKYCTGEFGSVNNNTSDESGYKLNYVWDSNDGYGGDRIKDLKDKTLCATVQTSAELAMLSIGRPLTTEDIAYVEAENMYYNVADATGSPILWDAWAERLHEYVSGKGDRSVDCEISTLCTYVEFNPTTQLYEKRNYVGCNQKGSYITAKNTTVLNEFGLRLFYIQKQVVGGVNIPVSFNHNRNAANVKTVPYSLAWQGKDGLAENFHKEWQDMKERGEIVKTKLHSVDKKLLGELRDNNCYEIDNVLYIPYQRSPSIPMRNVMEVEFMTI
jgi:hypothetical protein